MSSIGGGNGGGAGAVQVLDWKEAVETVATADIVLTGEQTLNGLLTSTSRVGVVAQADPTENGIYVSAAGAWARSADADTDAKVTNGLVFAVGDIGSTEAGKAFILTTPDPITLGVTLLTFGPFVVPAHASTHEDGGSDPLNMANLSHTHPLEEVVPGTPVGANTAGTSNFLTSPDGGADTAGDGGNPGGAIGTAAGFAGGAAADQDGGAGGNAFADGGRGTSGGLHTVNNPVGGPGGGFFGSGASGGAGGQGGSGDGGPGGPVSLSPGDGGDVQGGGSGTGGTGGDINANIASGGAAGGGSPGVPGRVKVKNTSNVVVAEIENDGGLIVGGKDRNASAILQADSTTKGAALPRMTTAQKNAIAAPLTGLVVFDTDLNRYEFFDGTVWRAVGSVQLDTFNANGVLYPSADPAGASARNGRPVIAYDDTTDENVIRDRAMSNDYLGGDISVDIDWVSDAIIGDATWGVEVERAAPGGLDIDTDSFAAQQTATDTVNGTSGVKTRTTITLTQAQADAIEAGDGCRIRVERVATDVGDDLVGDALITDVSVRQ